MLTEVKRLVLKLGTNIVIEDSEGNPALDRLKGIAKEIGELSRKGVDVVVISSGAVGLGRNILNGQIGKSLIEKQVCATVGQAALMNLWQKILEPEGLIPAQLLLTANDFERRESYLNLHQTIEQLLEMKIIPIINENDATSVSEIRDNSELSFGDNDRLSALVAARIGAQRLLILTSTDGVFTSNPETDSSAQRIAEITTLDELDSIVTAGQSKGGRGGMRAKLEAVRIASLCGVTVQISSGFTTTPIKQALEERAGTIISAQRSVPLRKGWIGHSSGYKGVIVVNQGAKEALMLSGSSLLPVGITEIRGSFARFDVIRLEDNTGTQLGRGLSSFSSDELNRIKGLQSKEISKLGIESNHIEAVHRDNLVLFQENGSDEG